MSLSKSIFIIAVCGTLMSAFTHKDRIERPISFKFIFNNGEIINVDKSNIILLDSVVNYKENLAEAQLTFKTGEVLTFKKKYSNWSIIKIVDKNAECIVPKEVIEKIPVIHFQTVALLWGDDAKTALQSGYFYINFDIGLIKSFDHFPNLHLNFNENKFSNAIIYKQVSENSTQRSDF
jgi:hypothetical protein